MAKKVQQDSGLQPFNRAKKESVVEFLQRTTWFQAMTTALQRHSEFMAPWSDDYPEMEYAYPKYSWGVPELPEGSTVEITSPLHGFCQVVCWDPKYCDEDVKCHFPISTQPAGMSFAEARANCHISAFNLNNGEPIGSSRIHSGDNTFPWHIAPPAGGWPDWPAHPVQRLRVFGTDAFGAECMIDVLVSCQPRGCCETGTLMTFDDDGTADTIARNNSITIYMKDGCGDYNWTVSGTGFSLANATTATCTNTLTADGTACGIATVTCTDLCGTSKTAKIRCTTGVWSVKSTTTCGLSGTGTYYWVPGNAEGWTLTSGNKKQLQATTYGGSCPSGAGSLCADVCFPGGVTCAQWCTSVSMSGMGKCISPYALMDTGCIDNPGWCCRYTYAAEYSEWECAP